MSHCVVYGSVVDLPSANATPTEPVGEVDLRRGTAEMVAIDRVTGAGAVLPLTATQHAVVVAFQLGAS